VRTSQTPQAEKEVKLATPQHSDSYLAPLWANRTEHITDVFSLQGKNVKAFFFGEEVTGEKSSGGDVVDLLWFSGTADKC
jgi:hypothetical protein